LRRERHTQEHIAAELGISKASVSRLKAGEQAEATSVEDAMPPARP
jgi:predicted transcriptional regulator